MGTPEVILGEYNAFLFGDNVDLKEHKATNEEIKHLLSDLQLLAKADFRRLLKWRLKMIKHLEIDQKEEKKEETEDKNKEYTQQELEEIEDEKLEADVREMFDRKKREKRKEKRKIRQE